MLDYKNARLVVETSAVEPGKVSWRSPSNLAVIKYWGKHGVQLPRNPSISLTLDRAYSETTLEYFPKKGVDRGIDMTFYFDGEQNEAFESRTRKFLESLADIFPFLRQLQLVIRSTNSFPHSSGIASSASGMSALALCLCSLEQKLFQTLNDQAAFRRKASYVARLGSGSACRSIYGVAAVWGTSGEVEGSSDEYAIPYAEKIHAKFRDYRDAILLVNKGEKAVSSRAGHELMNGNIFAENRYQQARQRLHYVLDAMAAGDLPAFGRILEAEAMTLHALMMTSNPPYILLQPNTLQLIQHLHAFRQDTGHPVYFSLDAGPNLHLLYPQSVEAAVKDFIEGDLKQYCQNEHWIEDGVGSGPTRL